MVLYYYTKDTKDIYYTKATMELMHLFFLQTPLWCCLLHKSHYGVIYLLHKRHYGVAF
jgi:hypothetical protein